MYLVIPPVNRDINVNDPSISHKHRDESVPSWLLIVGALIFSAIVLPVCSSPNSQAMCVIFAAFSCLLFSYSINLFIVHFLKSIVGRLRPDFLSRCILVDDICTGDPSIVREGRFSFPSGHASTSFHFCAFLCLVLYKKLSNHQKNSFQPPFIYLYLPLVCSAIFVTVSRVSDYWHHVGDVIIGSLIGILTGFYGFYVLNSRYLGCDKIDDIETLMNESTVNFDKV
ncbi:hypothetical protein P9112_004946 [Eukaryota sp. TZLM1-RC]